MSDNEFTVNGETQFIPVNEGVTVGCDGGYPRFANDEWHLRICADFEGRSIDPLFVTVHGEARAKQEANELLRGIRYAIEVAQGRPVVHPVRP